MNSQIDMYVFSRFPRKSWRAWWLMVCLCALVAYGAIGASSAAPRGGGTASGQFEVFDATLYSGKPDMRRFGVSPITVIYEHRLWKKGESKRNVPSESAIREVAEEAARVGHPVVIDIEIWPLVGDDAVVDANVDKYVWVMERMREAQPSLQMGYFGRAPIEVYHRAKLPRLHPQYMGWSRENERVAPIAQAADFVFPSIYTFSDDRAGWRAAAIENIRQARRYGKPVYVFLWPYYSEKSPVHAREPLPRDYWRLQLQTVYEHADGVVIWGGWDPARWAPAAWDENAEWWHELRAFISQIRMQ